ncbi:MAG: GNAT family N-acetyltransferase [Candidatus Thorarchaeota archaeon]
MKKIIELETGEEIIIRHVTQKDINGVWNNFNEVIEEGIYLPVFFPVRSTLEKESWYRKIREEKELCIVADIQKSRPPFNIIGQCEISNSPWDAGLHVGILGIIIKSDYRDLGIGTHLIDTAIRESQKLNNKEKITLSCFSTNERALHLYRKLGFNTVGVRKKQFYMDSKYYDEVLMELWIDDYLKES